MSWLDELRGELETVGIRGGACRRIELELADHLACDPASEPRLGSPRAVAERFAAELRIVRTRRAATRSFLSLAFTAVLLAAYARSLSPAGGWPDVFGVRGFVVAVAGLGIALPAQVAFVAGVLALMRRPHDAFEARLVQRRTRVALLAGATVAAADLVQAVALQPLLPLWWFAFALAAGAATVAALGGSAVVLHGAHAVTPVAAGAPGGLAADLPPPLRRYAAAIAPATGVAAVVAMTAGSAIAEHSLVEGLTRGVLEGLAFVGCFVALGRPLGIRG